MKIAHLADIQVRAHSRHEEFEKSFTHLYKSLRYHCPDRIVLAGDIVHNKTNISPELVHVVAKFFRNLCSIADVDLILGNHDLAMKNMQRMDALTPIVDAMNDTSMHFYRETGNYGFAPGFQYVVMSCLDQEAEWEKVRKKAANFHGVTIALWHGTINGVSLDNGSKLESPHGLDLFKGMDYVMLGDIHKTQILDEECRVAYPGSYPKQNWGEGEHGGYFLWDIQDKQEHSLDFIQLPTVCPYYTLELPDSLEVPRNPLWEKGARIRTMSRPINAAERKLVTGQVQEIYEPSEFKLAFTEPEKKADLVISEGVRVENLRDENVQKKLLKSYFDDLDAEQLETIYEINRDCSVSQTEVLRDVRYKILGYQFENLFSYGTSNTVNLEQMKGVVGIFGPNAAGKSTAAVDAPLYALFNRTSKDLAKNQQLVNDRETQANGTIWLQLNDQKYTIQRQTVVKRTKKRGGAIEVGSESHVSFKIESGQNLGDIDRIQTDKKIRAMFGSPEDFLQTSVAAQFDLLGFISNKATDRKKTIARYFDLQVFEEKHKQANEKLRDLKARLRALDQGDFDARIAEREAQREKLAHWIDDLTRQAESARRLCEFGRNKISELKVAEANFVGARRVKTAGIKAEYLSTRDEYDRLNDEIAEFDEYACIDTPGCCLAQRKIAVTQRLEVVEAKREAIKERLQEVSAEIKQATQDNAPQMEKLRSVQTSVDQNEENERSCRQNVLRFTREQSTIEADLKQLRSQKAEFGRIQGVYDLQERYTKAMGKDGLSYQIIRQNLGRINEEIALVLGTDLPFQVWLEDDEKEINVYFQNPGEQPRLIELCSGMEKTIAAILVRAALISVTSLPVGNVFVLDESFTSLDADHMQAMGRVLSGLKRLFDTIIVICHAETVKDLCDRIITVEKNGQGYSTLS